MLLPLPVELQEQKMQPPAVSQIVLVLFCIQTFDRHRDWFVDRTRM
jgi:hypothetical protein